MASNNCASPRDATARQTPLRKSPNESPRLTCASPRCCARQVPPPLHFSSETPSPPCVLPPRQAHTTPHHGRGDEGSQAFSQSGSYAHSLLNTYTPLLMTPSVPESSPFFGANSPALRWRFTGPRTGTQDGGGRDRTRTRLWAHARRALAGRACSLLAKASLSLGVTRAFRSGRSCLAGHPKLTAKNPKESRWRGLHALDRTSVNCPTAPRPGAGHPDGTRWHT